MKEKQNMIEICNMSKNFGVTVALNQVSFAMKSGEICGLIGENGSGKSTVSSIIAGMQQATKGDMFYMGQPWKPTTMLEAQKKGISMIVQETGTIPNITVAENIFMGHEDKFRKGPLISKKRMTLEAQKLLEETGIHNICAAAKTDTLDLQARKLVEIAKALYWNPSVFIVDETTTALSHEGRSLLYSVIHRLAENGKCVIFISHDLEELMEHCDSLTVLRDGVIIGRLEHSEFDDNTIKKMMVGREIKGDYYRADMDGYSDEVVLKADCITTMRDLLCFSMELHKGEILGIGGLSHCGMHTLGRALFGIEKVLDGEVITGTGKKVTSPKDAIEQRLGYVSKNRDSESVGLTATIYENIASTGYRKNCSIGPFLSFRKERKYVDEQVQSLMLKCASVHHTVDTLSGGNKQKVALGKWVAADAQILILDCPTRGIDVGVKAAIYKLMYDMKKAGKSIILISEELLELIGMCDRVLILKDGEIAFEKLRTDGLSEDEIIQHMI